MKVVKPNWLFEEYTLEWKKLRRLTKENLDIAKMWPVINNITDSCYCDAFQNATEFYL